MQQIHGGDIYRNRIKYDFSVNTNARGIPVPVQEALQKAVADCWKYPDIRCELLKQKIAEKEGISGDFLVCGNGASELFAAVVHALHPKKTVIPVPSFYGYEWAAGMQEQEIRFYLMKEESDYRLDEDFLFVLDEDTELIFLANPNNPVGNCVNSDLLERIIRRCKEKEIYVVLDECFLEFCEDEAEKSWKKKTECYENLLVVRAFTKTYAIPGVRLGYLITGNKKVREKIKKQLPEWNVSIFAQYAGTAAAEERSCIEETVLWLKEERKYVAEGLEQINLSCQQQGLKPPLQKIYPSEANFLLIETKLHLYEALLRQQILIRSCGNYRGLSANHYRIAIRSHAENEILLHKMQKIAEKFSEKQ